MQAPSSTRSSLCRLVLVTVLATAGCVSHQHSVGLGATGASEGAARQYYLLFGLVPANEVDAQRMAGNLTSYSIDTRFSLVDFLLAPLLLPLTITTRTVTVRT